MIYTLFSGFCMALADSVPGVSGGTIAFVMGFYDKFITSLADLFHGTKQEKLNALIFLVKLGMGWIVGMSLAVTILAGAFTTGIYKVSSLFLGFVIASIPLILGEERENISGRYSNIFWLFVGAAAVVLLSTLNFSAAVHGLGFTVLTCLYVFIAGVLAISAMVLPGISGSTLLMTFGLYIPVITGLKDALNMNFRSLWLLAALAAGVIVGVIFVMRGIKNLMIRHRTSTLFAVLGMMTGSLYAIVIGPTTLASPRPMMGLSDFDLVFFIVGCALVLGLAATKKWLKGKTEA